MTANEPTVGLTEVAHQAGVSAQTVRRDIFLGRLACIRTPYGRAVPASAVAAYVESRRARGLAVPVGA